MLKQLLFLLVPFFLNAQGYTSYFTGNSTNITTTPEFGVCLMGGASEHNEAMKWLLQKANGGDVVVLRSSGSNGYNNYLYSELGITVNSVETLVITSVAGATNPYVLDKVANAEMIWFAGGDQLNYVSFFKDNALEDLLNQHINVKNAPIGGTSAGMAILSGKYFNAQNGSVTSSQAMNNPYHPNVTLGYDDFLSVPYLENVITDTHYDNPDRRGRQSTFIARFKNDLNVNVKGVAANEYVAICIDENGKASVFGEYPAYEEYAFFVQANCSNPNNIETIQSGVPLTWNYNGQALKVYKVPGTMNGEHFFDMSNWESGSNSGGSWEHWSINNGIFASLPGTPIDCSLTVNDFSETVFQVSPNPFSTNFSIKGISSAKITLFDVQGRSVLEKENYTGEKIDTTIISPGIYVVQIEEENQIKTKKIIKY
ncbi:T9SS type A sorting domain-containing protein [Flavobacterium piscinae]|uniref:T9SS type A sorting domain-containing protein n=1 Tax=Flavobacterium piscinae TaxID=2506424 RepID=A0A4Q1KT54_9FLAO|nr:cyanophycinase [Flavobacterium piscinae]MBC8882741.1 T9SS type A sorting domain-containing protein [Flavobacterium piscinae]RXR32224.1 T9SS type A sorting domain-containing protein [Flavobacterium piscinae]